MSSQKNKSNQKKKQVSKKKITKRGSNSSKKSNNERLRNEIIGIIYIIVGILFLVSKRYESGMMFGYLTDFLKLLVGRGYVLVPYFCLVTGGLYFVNYIKNQNVSNIKYVLVIFLSIVSLVTINEKVILQSTIYEVRNFKTIIEYFSQAALSDPVSGGGIIGGLISYGLVFLFGRVGSTIVNAGFIIIGLILFTKKSFYLTTNQLVQKLAKFVKRVGQTIYEFVFIEEKSKRKVPEKTDKTTAKQDQSTGKGYLYNSHDHLEESKKQRVFDISISGKEITSEEGLNPIKQSEKNSQTERVPSDDKLMDKPHKKANERDDKKQQEKSEEQPRTVNKSSYRIPPISLLSDNTKANVIGEKQEAIESADTLLNTLKSFGIDCKLVQINRGPTITRYELQPAPGVKVSRITNLSKDIALSLAKSDVRIEAPIPGKAAVGIEVPNSNKSNVYIKDLVNSRSFHDKDISIPFAIGKDIGGKNIIADISAMPHLLIAGATGSGKSVCINALLISILYRAKPDQVKLILIDPKVVELNIYNGLPHLLIPVVTDPRKAANALGWAVQEMTNRYELFAQNSVRDIGSYNAKKGIENPDEVIPKIVIVIDELADLMMVAASDVEDSITRLAQLARAAGIHLVIATQRPSVDVITGTIKANISSRIAFSVSSYIDSRTILDSSGAEKLLGKGDLLYHPVGTNKHIRIQGVFVSDEEVKSVIDYIKDQGIETRQQQTIEEITDIQIDAGSDYDELLEKAAGMVVMEGQASVSYMQRKLKVGYARAARIIDQLEEIGVVGPHEGSKPRKVLINVEELEQIAF